MMWAFFHGWRRKAGCLLLGIALAILGMWGRSRIYNDLILIRPTSRTEVEISFGSSGIECEYRWPTEGAVQFEALNSAEDFIEMHTFDFDNEPHQDQILLPSTHTSLWKMYPPVSGLGAGFEIPYGTTVLSTTLLAGWLLIFDPRIKSKGQPNA